MRELGAPARAKRVCARGHGVVKPSVSVREDMVCVSDQEGGSGVDPAEGGGR